MAMSLIHKLTVKKFLWKSPGLHTEPFFCYSCIIEYKSGKTVEKDYFSDKDVPYTVRDFMKAENFKDMKIIESHGIFDIQLCTYMEG